MRGAVERRAVAIFRSRGGLSTSHFQSRSFSSGRGRGRDESEDAQGAYGSGLGSGFGLGVGRGSGLGDAAAAAAGRGRGSAVGAASPSSAPSSQPTPFKPFTLQPAQPAAAQQVECHPTYSQGSSESSIVGLQYRDLRCHVMSCHTKCELYCAKCKCELPE